MAQSLLTQRGVEYGSTMRSLQTVAAKKHPPKKWRSRNQSCSESSSSSSDSCSSSDSDGEGSSSRSSATAEREFSIVKESNFANAPLKLKIAARRIKKAQEGVTANFEQEDYLGESPLNVSDSVHNEVKGKIASVPIKCNDEPRERTQRCKRKIEKKRCLQTKDARISCSGPYATCKAPRKSRRCSTSGSSSSTSSSGSSSGSSGSSSSGSSSGSSTGCSSGSSSGSSSSGSSSTSGSSSSSSSSSRSSSGSESETCCSASNYARCRRRKSRRRKASTKCQATCTLQCKKPQTITESSRESLSNSQSVGLIEKVGFGKGGKRISNDCSRNKKLQVSDIDYFTISSSDENCSTEDKNANIQECFSMWRKVEEKHCAIIGDTPGNGDLQMQVLSVTNAEVECNINVSGNIGLLSATGEQHFLVNNKCENQNSTECDFNFHSLEQLPSLIKGHVTVATTSLDLDTLPVSLSNVSPDSGIQSSGDSPLRVDCEITTTCSTRDGNQTLVSLVDEYFDRRDSSEVSNKFNDKQGKLLSPAPSPPVLIPHDPLWTPRITEQTIVEIQKSEEDRAPYLVQEDIDVKLKRTTELKGDKIYTNYKEVEFTTVKELSEGLLESVGSEDSKSNSLHTHSNNDISSESKELNIGAFSQNPLHLIFNDQSVGANKSECSVYSEQSSPQLLSSETRRPKARTPRRLAEANLKADNELQLLVQSVQDSISSQFQTVESDELSDVDVSSIPVTALTCDTTSDSFCDKLSSEDNIAILLNGRTCMHGNEDNSKSFDSSTSMINCNVICSTNKYNSNNLSELADNKPSEKDSTILDSTNKLLLPKIQEPDSDIIHNASDNSVKDTEKDLNCTISTSDNDDQISKITVSGNAAICSVELSCNNSCAKDIATEESDFVIPPNKEDITIIKTNTESFSNTNEYLENDNLNQLPDKNIKVEKASVSPNLKEGEKKGRGRPRKYPKVVDFLKSTGNLLTEKQKVSSLKDHNFANKKGRKSSNHSCLSLGNESNSALKDDVNPTSFECNPVSNIVENEHKFITPKEERVRSKIKNTLDSRIPSKDSLVNIFQNNSPKKKTLKCPHPKNLNVDSFCEMSDELEELINTPVIITDDKDNDSPPKCLVPEVKSNSPSLTSELSSEDEATKSVSKLSKKRRNTSSAMSKKKTNLKNLSKIDVVEDTVNIIDIHSIEVKDDDAEPIKPFNGSNTTILKEVPEIKNNGQTNIENSSIVENVSIIKSDDESQSLDEISNNKKEEQCSILPEHINTNVNEVKELIQNVESEISVIEKVQVQSSDLEHCPVSLVSSPLKPKSNRGRKSKKKNLTALKFEAVQTFNQLTESNCRSSEVVKKLEIETTSVDILPPLTDKTESQVINGEVNESKISLPSLPEKKSKTKKLQKLNSPISQESLVDIKELKSRESPQNASENIITPIRSKRIRDFVAKNKKSFENIDAVIDEVAQSGISIKDIEVFKDNVKTSKVQQESESLQPNVLQKGSPKKKCKKNMPLKESTKQKLATPILDKTFVSENKDNKINGKQELDSPHMEKRNLKVFDNTHEKVESKSLNVTARNSGNTISSTITKSPEKQRKRKKEIIKSQDDQPTISISKNNGRPSVRKCDKRRPVDANGKEDVSSQGLITKINEKPISDDSKETNNHDIGVSNDKIANKKLNSKHKPLPKKIPISNSSSKNIAKMQNNKPKQLINKTKIVNKSKCHKVHSKEMSREKLRSASLTNKSKVANTEKVITLVSKDLGQELIAEVSQISPKISKKDTKKSKVDEEKENLDIRKVDRVTASKSKAKLEKDLKCTKLPEDTKKTMHHEKGDALSSLSVNEEYRVTSACGSSVMDKQLSLEIRPTKKKRSAKLYYAEDPNFNIELEILAELLEACYISKKRSKLKDELLNSSVPSVFQFNPIIKEKSTRTSNSSKISKNVKDKGKVVKKKPKKLVKLKSALKVVPNQKSKVIVNENCLPLKKRRHITSNQVQNSKAVINDTLVPKVPSIKRNFTLKNSFDETIEECIRKHMMKDEVPDDKPPLSQIKNKSKATKLRDSIDEAIDSCIKNNVLSPKVETIETSIKKVEEEAEDIPLASLLNLKKENVTEIIPKPKSADSSLAYRQKRKRILKEACAQSTKVQKDIPVESNLNAQRKKRRFRNKTGFVRVKKKKARTPLNTEIIDATEVSLDDGEVIDLTTEDAMIDSIESVVKASIEPEVLKSRRKRKNVAHKCEIEVLDLTSGNDDNDIECLSTKRSKMSEEEALEPKYQQIIPVTEPSSGRRLVPVDPRKARRREVHFHKKKYLRAGLYSAYFKQDCPTPKKSSKKSRSREVKEYKPEEHEFGLMPPPIHVGRYLREKRGEFKLSFDIWWLYKNKQLVYNDEISNNYKKIRTNVYVDIKPDSKNDDQSCNCAPPRDNRKRGCGTECLNRMMYVECTPQMCPCREQCSNQRIFKHEWSPGLERFMTKNRGWGIRTTEFIRAGEFILEYVGEVVSDTEFRHRMAERYRNDQHHYCLSLDSGTVIDGYRLAGEGRFVNHSCEPNCEMQKWYVNGHYRVGLFSLRDIFPNTELCYDYNFVNYNLETQQICRCGSSRCRGFIGGRSQKVNGQAKEKVKQAKAKIIADSKKGPGRPKKRKDERPVEIQKEHIKNEYLPYNRQSFTIQMKPMSHQQRCYVQKHHCFLLRNYEKVKKAKDEARIIAEKEAERENAVNKQDAFLTQFTALNTSRSVKTRRLAIVEENTELTQKAKLAQVFKDIFTAVTSCKDEEAAALASPFFQLPSKKKNPAYYSKIKFPIDFTTIEKNILTGHYTNVEVFEDDFLRLFENAEEFYGRASDLGHKISLLRKAYEAAKTDAMILFEDILGDAMASVFTLSKPDDAKTDEDDEVIRCICNIYKDEGLMIQCEKCLVWQHCDCVGVDGKVEKYLCEQCSGTELSKEILMIPRPHYATTECQYYLTLLLNELQIKQGDCVYLKRDDDVASHPSNESIQGQIVAQGIEIGDVAARASLRSKKAKLLDIFRIERLWKDEHDNKFAFGHHYLRPHETYHEPSRKFFPNEVFRVPLYEIIPLDNVASLCCVLDLPTYCKGRPKGFKEEDTYICEYRVDKTAHLFYKISKIKFPICTKKYAFDCFDKRRNPKRTFLPHAVPNNYNKKGSSDRGSTSDKKNSKSEVQKEEKKKRGSPKEIGMRLEESQESREQKRAHLNELLLKLLNQIPCKQTIDLSYLLEGGLGKRIRRKTNLSLS